MNQTFRSGIALHRLIEDAPLELLRVFLEPHEAGPANASTDGPVDEPRLRSELHARYGDLVAEVARRLDDDAGRILVLGGPGAWALSRVAEERLDQAAATTFAEQRDAIGRSLWCFQRARPIFDDAESLHYASRYRGYGKLYAAFEVPDPAAFHWNEDLQQKLATQIVDRLDLRGPCTLSHIALQKGADIPPEHVLIVRHAGPLSSIPEHREDGHKTRHYYRPPNEATLIYSPLDGMVEICAASPAVRQKIGICFAETGLGQSLSNKPLTYKYYDLSRFSRSLKLPLVQPDGFAVDQAAVIEVDLRPNHPRRKVTLRVATEDDIEEVADDLFGEGFFRRSGELVRVVIAIPYQPNGGGLSKTLTLSVSHPNSCNLRSLEDPIQRELASALLKAWGILETFQPLTEVEEHALLPALLELYDMLDDVVLESMLRSRGLDVEMLARRSFIERRGRHKVILVEPDDDGPEEVAVTLAAQPDALAYQGADRRTAVMPRLLVQQYGIKRSWIEETIAENLRPDFARRAFVRLGDHLAYLGEANLVNDVVPCYLARGLGHMPVFERLDHRLRAENSGRRGIVLDAGRSGLSFLAAHVVIPFGDYLAPADSGHALDIDALSAAFERGRQLAGAAAAVELIRHGSQTATLRIPGKDALSLMGPKQINIFDRLVKAYRRNAEGVPTAELMEGSSSRSPQNAFTPEKWKAIEGRYIAKVGMRLGWRLVVELP